MKYKWVIVGVFIFNLFILSGLAITSSALKRSSDNPSVPDESDMDVIDEYIKSEKNQENATTSSSNANRDSLNGATTTTSSNSTTTTPKPLQNANKPENSASCKCVKYYQCEVKKDEVTTEATATTPQLATPTTVKPEESNAGTESSQDILGVVDIRNDIKCPDFEVCCALKNIKTEIITTTTPSTPTSIKTTTSKTPAPYTGHRHCGHRNENGIGQKKGTGKEAQFAEFPWTAAVINLEKNEDNYTILMYVGVGSLIHPQVVLTIAHNVLGKSRTTLKVRLGEWDTQTTDEPYPSQDRGVKKVIIHELFLKKTLYNDVALLILDEEIHFAPNVDTVCLPPLPKKGKQPMSFEGQLCYSAGWGKDQIGPEGRFSDIMKKITVPVVSNEQCQKELQKSEKLPKFRLDKSFMCAGGGERGEDTCKGDGGSPLVCSVRSGGGDEEDTVHYVQVGAVSWGLGCNSTVFPGVYANIQHLTPWILSKLKQEDFSAEYCTLK